MTDVERALAARRDAKTKPVKPVVQKCKDKKKHWITIRLEDEDTGKQIAGAVYKIWMGGAEFTSGALVGGEAYLCDLDDDNYEVSFTEIDKKEWRRK